MAVVDGGGGRVLVASDMLLDGVHFDSTRHDLAMIGRKAIACNLSDCAAMAVRPLAAVVSVALPGAWTLAKAKELFEGMFAVADEFGLAIVGGDTTSWRHPLAIDVAITAVPYDGIEPVRRSGARVGDTLCVTGKLGGSLMGRHLTFTPRVTEARTLAGALGNRLHAMMDISDGLSLDLWRMCDASGVGAVLSERLLLEVVSDAAKRMSEADGRPALEHALSDGEDFELLLAVDPNAGEPAEWSARLGVPIGPVGRITETGYGIELCDGRVETLQPKGYVH